MVMVKFKDEEGNDHFGLKIYPALDDDANILADVAALSFTWKMSRSKIPMKVTLKLSSKKLWAIKGVENKSQNRLDFPSGFSFTLKASAARSHAERAEFYIHLPFAQFFARFLCNLTKEKYPKTLDKFLFQWYN